MNASNNIILIMTNVKNVKILDAKIVKIARIIAVNIS